MEDNKINANKIIRLGKIYGISYFKGKILKREYYFNGKLYYLIGGYPKSQYFQYPDANGKIKLVDEKDLKKYGLDNDNISGVRSEVSIQQVITAGKSIGRIVSDIYEYRGKYYSNILVIDEKKMLLHKSNPDNFAENASPYDLSFFKLKKEE